MQNSLFNFYYVCWMELDCIKQNPFNQKGHLLEQECLFNKKNTVYVSNISALSSYLFLIQL